MPFPPTVQPETLPFGIEAVPSGQAHPPWDALALPRRALAEKGRRGRYSSFTGMSITCARVLRACP